jgi:hypothetical protein
MIAIHWSLHFVFFNSFRFYKCEAVRPVNSQEGRLSWIFHFVLVLSVFYSEIRFVSIQKNNTYHKYEWNNFVWLKFSKFCNIRKKIYAKIHFNGLETEMCTVLNRFGLDRFQCTQFLKWNLNLLVRSNPWINFYVVVKKNEKFTDPNKLLHQNKTLISTISYPSMFDNS